MTAPQQRAASASATWHQRAYEHLYALSRHLGRYDEISVELADDTLHVVYDTGTCEQRREQVTCKPRPSDGDRLWMWDSRRTPLAEAEQTVTATLAVVSRLREGLPRPWERT